MNTTAVATSPQAEEPPPYDTAPAQMQSPSRLFESGERSQATQIEQARAVAEVQAAIVVAQNRPRDMDRALDEMRKVCTIEMMADRAFSSFPKGGTTVSMGSIHLARELARIWGNVGYGSAELSRNDAKGESEMMAYAWDLQTNVRPQTTFIVPHFIDLSGGRKKKLTDARSVYENNANMAARRMRVQIFAVIPRWFTDEAEDLCRRTLEHGGGKPFKERLAEAVKAMASIDVTPAMIEKKFGCSMVTLTSAHLADLRIIYRSIKNGEIDKEEAFPETPAADLDARLVAKDTKNGPGPTVPASDKPQQSATPVNYTTAATDIIKSIMAATTVDGVNKIEMDNNAVLNQMNTDAPDQLKRVDEALAGKRATVAKK